MKEISFINWIGLDCHRLIKPIRANFRYNNSLFMSEFLKEYHLYEDLARLNHDDYFQDSFDTLQTADFFASLSTKGELELQSRSVRIFFFNLRHTSDKNVYLVLKWLLTCHRLLPKLGCQALKQDMLESLARMGKVPLVDNSDRFVSDSLLRPYLHYLRKLAQIQLTPHPESLPFMKYNLVSYALNQLVTPLSELWGFFDAQYPLLNAIGPLISRDLNAMLSEIKQAQRGEIEEYVSRLEIESLEAGLVSLGDGVEQWECGLGGSQLQFFLQSGCKNNMDKTNHSLAST